MGDKWTEVLGFVSGALATAAFIPQVVTVWTMRPAPAIAVSLATYVIFSLGVTGWFVYGVRIKKLPVMVWNAITLVLALSILVYKCIYG